MVHFLAPVVLVIAAFLAYAVLPFGRNMMLVESERRRAVLLRGRRDGGAVGFHGRLVEPQQVFAAGRDARHRADDQLRSAADPRRRSWSSWRGSLSTVDDRRACRRGYSGIWPHWYVFTPWGLAGFILFMIAATAESNRSPFDLPEGESEIIAGYYIEYSGFKFALFFLGEYLGMFAISGLGITLFLGGWSAPFSFLTWIPSYLWFFAKLLALIVIFIWIRGTLPRLRMDQLMNFCLEFMLPMALINMFVAGIWHFMPAGWYAGWSARLMLVVPAHPAQSRPEAGQEVCARTYRFAD